MNFGERGFMALAESLPNIKDCSKLTLWRMVFFNRPYRCCWRLSKEHQLGKVDFDWGDRNGDG
jgi:hypothetical protein